MYPFCNSIPDYDFHISIMFVNINGLGTEMTTQRAAAISFRCLFMNAAFCFLDDPEENKFTGTTTIQENNELNGKRENRKKKNGISRGKYTKFPLGQVFYHRNVRRAL